MYWDCANLAEIREKVKELVRATDKVESLLFCDITKERADIMAKDCKRVSDIAMDLYRDFDNRRALELKKDEIIRWGALSVKNPTFTNKSQFKNGLRDMGYLDEA